MERNKIEIIGHGGRCAKVLVDGKEIHGVRGYTLSHYANDLPELEIDLGGMDMSVVLPNVDIKYAEVKVKSGV